MWNLPRQSKDDQAVAVAVTKAVAATTRGESKDAQKSAGECRGNDNRQSKELQSGRTREATTSAKTVTAGAANGKLD